MIPTCELGFRNQQVLLTLVSTNGHSLKQHMRESLILAYLGYVTPT